MRVREILASTQNDRDRRLGRVKAYVNHEKVRDATVDGVVASQRRLV